MQSDKPNPAPEGVFDEIVNTLYRAILRRPPDAGGRAAYLRLLQQGRSELDLIKLLIGSREFNESILIPASERRLVKLDDYDPDKDEDIKRYTTRNTKELAAVVRKASISDREFQEVVDQAVKIHPQVDYLNFHKKRFYEIDVAVKNLSEPNTRQLHVLDFGFSINSLMLRLLFPDMMLSIADRPQIRISEGRFDRTHIVDLLDDKLNEVDLGNTFDLIIFAEVIEHVLVHPKKIVTFLLKHLNEHGSVMLTTPNSFSRGKMRRISQRKNPLELFPESYIQADAPHFHVREYCMSEMLAIIEAAGGFTRTFFFSGCWDDPKLAESLPEHELGNMFFLFGKREIERP